MLQKLIRPVEFFVTALSMLCIIAFFQGCSSDDAPPHFAAQVTNVYKETVTVEKFAVLYSWEERGETPFLKPYSLISKELIVERMIPSTEDPHRVTIVTEKYGLASIDTIDIALTPTGKEILLTLKDGRHITATNNFPAILKKDPKSGFADTKVYIRGKCIDQGKPADYKTDLNYIKRIKILSEKLR